MGMQSADYRVNRSGASEKEMRDAWMTLSQKESSLYRAFADWLALRPCALTVSDEIEKILAAIEVLRDVEDTREAEG